MWVIKFPLHHKCTSPSSAIQVKNRQKTVSTEEKLDIISLLQKGECSVDVCHNVRLAYSIVCTICDNANRNIESAKC